MPHKRAKASIRRANSLRMGFDLPPNQPLNPHKKRKIKKNESSQVNQSKNEEVVSKNLFRILNAEKIRTDYRLKKLELNQPEKSNQSSASGFHSTHQSGDSKTITRKNQRIKSSHSSNLRDELKILPSENLGSFNRRVEETLRPKVTAAFKSARRKQNDSNNIHLTNKKNQVPLKLEDAELKLTQELNQTNQVKDFAPRPRKFPITDTVMEPPNFQMNKSIKKLINSTSTVNPNNNLPISCAQKRIMQLERNKAIERYRKMKEERNAQN